MRAGRIAVARLNAVPDRVVQEVTVFAFSELYTLIRAESLCPLFRRNAFSARKSSDRIAGRFKVPMGAALTTSVGIRVPPLKRTVRAPASPLRFSMLADTVT